MSREGQRSRLAPNAEPFSLILQKAIARKQGESPSPSHEGCARREVKRRFAVTAEAALGVKQPTFPLRTSAECRNHALSSRERAISMDIIPHWIEHERVVPAWHQRAGR